MEQNTLFAAFLFGCMIGEACAERSERYRHLRLHTLPNHGVHEDGERNHSTKGHYLSQKQTSRDVMRIMGSMVFNSC